MMFSLKEHSIAAILLMAGTGSRFGSGTPKQFHRLAGKKVYLHTLQTFLESSLFDQIVLVVPSSWKAEVEKDLLAYAGAPITLAEGGPTRQSSSLSGLRACSPHTRAVVIHDAVRPFVSLDILKDNIASALQYGAVDTCIPSADTLVYAPEASSIASIPTRSDYQRGQTPQSFDYRLILDAHLKAPPEAAFSDDCALVLRLGHPIHIAAGSEENIKITSELDLYIAEQLLRLRHARVPQEDRSLAGMRVAVTGASGGIGRALCQLLEDEGALPIPISRTSPYAADLTSYAAAQKIFDAIHAEHGPLDALVNCVGRLKTGTLESLPSDEIEKLISTNLTAVIYSCKCARLKTGGHIVNIASSSYSRGRKHIAAYASAKAAVVNFTQGLAEERPDLCINALAPERTLTPMRLDNFPGEDPATLLDPLDVAKEILSLLKTSRTGTLAKITLPLAGTPSRPESREVQEPLPK